MSDGRKCRCTLSLFRKRASGVNFLSFGTERYPGSFCTRGRRLSQMHSHYSRVRCSLSCTVRMIIALFWTHCWATQLNFVMQLRSVRMKTLKKLIMFVHSPRADIPRRGTTASDFTKFNFPFTSIFPVAAFVPIMMNDLRRFSSDFALIKCNTRFLHFQ